MDFLLFPKIPTNVKSSPQSYSGSWVAQEKVHGAQLVAGVSSEKILFGKRKAWLNEQDSFFGWQLLRSNLQTFCSKLFASFPFPKGTVAYFYGEFFGGSYPHSLVKPIEGMQPVQTGIWYSPSYQWMIFDAVVYPGGLSSEAYFMGARELGEAINSVGGICPPIISRGRINDLLRLPVRFASKVPEMFHLPEIAGNWAEGMVIKPENSLPIEERAVLKRKIDEFDEKRFDESEAWDSNQMLSFEGLSSWVSKMVNLARLASARSKVGDSDPKALIEEMTLDILIDLEAAFPKTMQILDPGQEDRLKLSIAELAERLSNS